MIRQIIGKCANGLTKLIRIRCGDCPLNPVALQIIEQGPYFVFYTFIHFFAFLYPIVYAVTQFR